MTCARRLSLPWPGLRSVGELRMKQTRIYLLPGLAAVTVTAEVLELVSDAIEFQLGHFALPVGATAPTDLPRISFEPYRRYAGGTGAVHFHAARAQTGRLLHSPEARYAVCRDENGFAVFTDTPEVLVVLLLQTLALARARTFLHAAGWCDAAGAVTLLPGPGGVGKTALLSAAVLSHGARLLGDDLVLVGATGAEAFPRAFVLKDYHRTIFPDAFAAAATERHRRDLWRPLVKFLRENAPFHGLLKSVFRRAGRLESASSWLHARSVAPEFHTVPVARLFGSDKVAAAGPIRRVIWLERHAGEDFRLGALSVDEAVRRSLAVLHHEWADYLRWFCALGAVDLVDVGAHFRGTEAALRASFAVAEVRLFQVPEGVSPDELERAFAERLGFAPTSS